MRLQGLPHEILTQPFLQILVAKTCASQGKCDEQTSLHMFVIILVNCAEPCLALRDCSPRACQWHLRRVLGPSLQFNRHGKSAVGRDCADWNHEEINGPALWAFLPEGHGAAVFLTDLGCCLFILGLRWLGILIIKCKSVDKHSKYNIHLPDTHPFSSCLWDSCHFQDQVWAKIICALNQWRHF